MGTTTTEAPVTDRQIAFLARLAAERAVTGDRTMDGTDPEADARTAQVAIARSVIKDPSPWTRRQVSKLIDMLMAFRPDVAAGSVARTTVTEPVAGGLDLSAVPSGRYAVPGGDTRLKVRIDVVEKGKWAGWVFVKDAAEYGQGRKYGAQRPGGTYRGDIEVELAAIAADPREASAAYGRLVGACGVCGRHLEDADSVARGIGPVCATRF